MIGVSLSRWTMSYFTVALVALFLGEFLMAAGYGFPSAPIRSPQTLVVVHLIAIGWLSLLLCGALFQFVPVLVARPLHSNFLPLPTLVLLVGGVVALLGGFLQLADAIDVGMWLFPLAAALLSAGFALVLYNLGRTLWLARPLTLPARFVAIALLSIATTVTLGSVFGVVFALPVDSDILLTVAAGALPIHVVAGLGGWLTFAAIGVSYRLLAMFMLAPELEGIRPRAVLWLGTTALAVMIVGGLALLLQGTTIVPALLVGALLSLVALVLYGADILHLFRARKRRIIELNSQMAAFSLVSLAMTVVLVVALIAIGHFYDHVGAVVFLAAFGWLTGLGLAQLFKIVAFMTWLECYGPVLGKHETPRVQDLVVERRARRWFVMYFAATWSATAALLFSQTGVFRIAAGAMAVATFALITEFTRTRSLVDLPIETRFPEGTRKPHPLVSSSSNA